MAGTSSGIVAALTAAALGAVGFLAYQAQAHVPPGLGRPGPDASASASAAARERHSPGAAPGGTGTGDRVVYSLDDDRVWLVRRGDLVQRSFRVTPGTVDPLPGAYWVTSRSSAVIGTDGVPVEHVVRFTSVGGVVVGFSAATASRRAAGSAVRTGGIRETRADGDAMWGFATVGVKVVVIR
ncbi:hypothetical protein ABZ636_25250 [Streptomyces sp. NPDC007251]|uniref:hypothetical protein n=1 Tax=unclassified Streptomyces TaxID=2593676 RepID=UPI0033CF3070